jgi:hypothetical protein
MEYWRNVLAKRDLRDAEYDPQDRRRYLRRDIHGSGRESRFTGSGRTEADQIRDGFALLGMMDS